MSLIIQYTNVQTLQIIIDFANFEKKENVWSIVSKNSFVILFYIILGLIWQCNTMYLHRLDTVLIVKIKKNGSEGISSVIVGDDSALDFSFFTNDLSGISFVETRTKDRRALFSGLYKTRLLINMEHIIFFIISYVKEETPVLLVDGKMWLEFSFFLSEWETNKIDVKIVQN